MNLKEFFIFQAAWKWIFIYDDKVINQMKVYFYDVTSYFIGFVVVGDVGVCVGRNVESNFR